MAKNTARAARTVRTLSDIAPASQDAANVADTAADTVANVATVEGENVRETDAGTSLTIDANADTGAAGDNVREDGEGRAPTAEEIASSDEESAIVNAAIENASSIADAAEKAFNSAAEGSESRLMSAVSFLSLRLVMQQARKTLTGGLEEDSTDRFVFNEMLFRRVMAGKSIYRGDADALAAILATDAIDRKEAATAHVKAKGAKLNKTLALIRQYGFALAGYVRANHVDMIRELAQAAQTGVGDKATLKAWTLFVVGEFGSTFSGLTHNLEARLQPGKDAAKAKAQAKREEAKAIADAAKAEADAKEEADKAEAMRVADAIREENRDKVGEAMDIIATMNDAEIASLAERLRAFMADRTGEVPATGEDDDATTGETLELTALAA